MQKHQRITAGKLKVGDKVIALHDHNTDLVTYKNVFSIENVAGTRRVLIHWQYEGDAQPFKIPTYEGINAVHWAVA